MKKKKIALKLVCIIVVAMLFTLSGCARRFVIDTAFQEVIEAESYTLNYCIDTPYWGDFTITVKCDGNKRYNSEWHLFNLPERYKEKVDGKVYLYEKDHQGNWVKSLTEASAEDCILFTEDELAEVFNAKSYRFSKNKDGYVLKKNAQGTFPDKVVTSSWILEKGSRLIFDGKIIINDYVMPLTMFVEDVNNTQIILPEVV